jgi:pimeloyl-ACP methyl ester carboxylesterase
MVVSILHDVYGDPSKVNDALVDRYYQLTLREGNRRALVQRLQQSERGQDAERIAELKLPTLIVWGGRDRLIPVSVARQFQTAIKGSELVVFDELGHVPQEEDPVRTVAVLKNFLARD